MDRGGTAGAARGRPARDSGNRNLQHAGFPIDQRIDWRRRQKAMRQIRAPAQQAAARPRLGAGAGARAPRRPRAARGEVRGPGGSGHARRRRCRCRRHDAAPPGAVRGSGAAASPSGGPARPQQATRAAPSPAVGSPRLPRPPAPPDRGRPLPARLTAAACAAAGRGRLARPARGPGDIRGRVPRRRVPEGPQLLLLPPGAQRVCGAGEAWAQGAEGRPRVCRARRRARRPVAYKRRAGARPASRPLWDAAPAGADARQPRAAPPPGRRGRFTLAAPPLACTHAGAPPHERRCRVGGGHEQSGGCADLGGRRQALQAAPPAGRAVSSRASAAPLRRAPAAPRRHGRGVQADASQLHHRLRARRPG
jgi:hypothetical protein